MKVKKILAGLLSTVIMLTAGLVPENISYLLPFVKTIPNFSAHVQAEENLQPIFLSYHVGTYHSFDTDTSGNVFITIDEKIYNVTDDCLLREDLIGKTVLFELYDDKIAQMYAIDEVIYPEITVEPSVKDGIVYQNGKFSEKNSI